MLRRASAERTGVVWHGSFFVHHSLAHVNRELTLALMERPGLDLGTREYEQRQFEPDRDPRYAALAARCRYRPDRPAVFVRHLWPPDFARPETPTFVVIQPWEFGSAPTSWVKAIRESVDELWVPSTFVRETFTSGGVDPDRVHVVPNGVNTARFRPGLEPLELATGKTYRFLFVGGTISRKGIDVLLRAYSRTFTHRDDVALVIKDFGAGSFYKGQDAGAMIAEAQSRPGAPEIVHLTTDMSEDDMASLYAACDCSVQPYRGEGYGMPIAEAMACGLPTIVTNFGAALDFTDRETSYLIPARIAHLPEKRIGEWETVDFPFWAEPDAETLGAQMRWAFEHPDEAARKGAKAAARIAERHTWSHAAEIAETRLRAVRTRSRHRPAVTPTDPKTEAIAIARQGRWEEALVRLETLHRTDPDDEITNALAAALFRTGQRERAEGLLRQAVAAAADARDLRHNLAFILLESGKLPEALAHALAAFESSRDSADVRRTLERSRQAVQREVRRLRRAGRATKGPKRDETVVRMSALVAQADRMLESQHGAAPSARSCKPRLSLVMIVKDEERFLRECLASARDAVDDIVIVDTGSTDRTVAIAEEFGAFVHHRPWDDDFSAARNFGLERATGDWALWLDADERLPEGAGRLLRTLVSNAPRATGGYMVGIRNLMTLSDPPEVILHRACRLFRVLPGIRFEGRIHEQNGRSIQNSGLAIAPCNLSIDHYGYAQQVVESRQKNERFIRMLHREVDEAPVDAFRPFHLFNLANAYYTARDHENAALWFSRAADLADPREDYTETLYIEWAISLYTLGCAQEALDVCERAERAGVRHPSIQFARGHACLRLNKLPEAEIAFRAALELGSTPGARYSGDSGAYGSKARFGLASALAGQERHDEAIDQCRLALAEQPALHDSRLLLGASLRAAGRPAEACEVLQGLLRDTGAFAGAHGELGMARMDMQHFSEALTHMRSACEEAPGDLQIRIGLAGCCDRLSLRDEALCAWTTACGMNPQSPALRVNLGRAQAACGDEAEALASFAAAIRIDADYSNGYFNAADILYRIGQHSQAAEAAIAGLQRDPTNAAGFLVVGNCCMKTNDLEAAQAAYREALRLKPDYAEARNNLEVAEEVLQGRSEAAA